MKNGLVLLLCSLLLSSCSSSAHRPLTDEEYEADVDDEASLTDDAEYLDGFVGLGFGYTYRLTEPEDGRRRYFRVEFARLRKWISIDARVGFGKGYSDYGGLFRVAKHWRFDGDSATGISLGAGVGALFSDGVKPRAGFSREAFIDVIGAPFLRFIWDFGRSMGLAFEAEYQVVPKTMFVNDNEDDTIKDVSKTRQRFYGSVSLLLEVE